MSMYSPAEGGSRIGDFLEKSRRKILRDPFAHAGKPLRQGVQLLIARELRSPALGLERTFFKDALRSTEKACAKTLTESNSQIFHRKAESIFIDAQALVHAGVQLAEKGGEKGKGEYNRFRSEMQSILKNFLTDGFKKMVQLDRPYVGVDNVAYTNIAKEAMARAKWLMLIAESQSGDLLGKKEDALWLAIRWEWSADYLNALVRLREMVRAIQERTGARKELLARRTTDDVYVEVVIGDVEVAKLDYFDKTDLREIVPLLFEFARYGDEKEVLIDEHRGAALSIIDELAAIVQEEGGAEIQRIVSHSLVRDAEAFHRDVSAVRKQFAELISTPKPFAFDSSVEKGISAYLENLAYTPLREIVSELNALHSMRLLETLLANKKHAHQLYTIFQRQALAIESVYGKAEVVNIFSESKNPGLAYAFEVFTSYEFKTVELGAIENTRLIPSLLEGRDSLLTEVAQAAKEGSPLKQRKNEKILHAFYSTLLASKGVQGLLDFFEESTQGIAVLEERKKKEMEATRVIVDGKEVYAGRASTPTLEQLQTLTHMIPYYGTRTFDSVRHVCGEYLSRRVQTNTAAAIDELALLAGFGYVEMPDAKMADEILEIVRKKLEHMSTYNPVNAYEIIQSCRESLAASIGESYVEDWISAVLGQLRLAAAPFKSPGFKTA